MSLGLSQTIQLEKRHFAICIFNRATYSRSQELIKEISNHPSMSLDVLLASGAIMEEHGDASKYIQDSSKSKVIKLDAKIKDHSHRGSIDTTSNIMVACAEHFMAHRYDAVILVADRFETLGAAIAASYLNLPIIHIQGGEVTGNIDEKVRHAVTKLADYHFVSTQCAKKYILEMGEEHFRTYLTGCPSLDIISRYDLRRYKPKKKYILCQFHPHTKEADLAFEQTETVLKAVLEYCAKNNQECYWYWPNPDPGREEVVKLLEKAHAENPKHLIRAENEAPLSFLERLAGSTFIIGNSSCGIRECSFLGVPAINIGDRQSIRERSWNVVDVGFDEEALKSAMETQKHVYKYKRSKLYGDGHASENIVKHLEHLDFSLKDTLTYPFNFKHRELHFGEQRLEAHGKRRDKPRYGRYQTKSAGKKAVGMDI